MATVQSVDRALAIIERLALQPKGASIKELADYLKLPKSTVHRLLSTLIQNNYVRQDVQNDKYLLTMKLVGFSSLILESLNIRDVARAYLEELSNQTNEVVHLCIREEDEVIYIDKVEGEQTIRMYSQIGKRALLHCTGVGKIFLSDINEKEIKEIIKRKGLPKFTENTITELEELNQHLLKIREQGFSIDEREHEEGIRCIAAPVYDYTKSIVAAISVSGPIDRMTKERIESGLKEVVINVANKISKRMGYFNG